jgi:hypothetical protein
MCTIYVLECDDNKFYVGKTNRINNRILEHFNNYGSEWTKKYRPLNVREIIENADNADEDKYVKIYMSKYGIHNVRGGSYSQITLPEYKLAALSDELNTLNNNCFKCGKPGHYANNCITCFKCGKPGHYANNCITCFKCGKPGHYANKCNISDGEKQQDVEKCYCCGKTGHSYKNCDKLDKSSNSIKQQDMEKCYCCGRTGHSYKNCNCRETIYGDKIDRTGECTIL